MPYGGRERLVFVSREWALNADAGWVNFFRSVFVAGVFLAGVDEGRVQ